MGKFDGILICTDLDGTLYRKDKSISKENKDAIEYFKREGGYFTFITGRMPYYSMDAYDAASPNVPFGCINGGGIYDGVSGKYVWTCDISRDVFDLVESVELGAPEVGIQVCCYDKTYFYNDNEGMQWFRKITKLPGLFCHYREVKEPISKIIFCTEVEDEIVKVEKILKEHRLANEFEFVRSERRLFEILPKGVNKGLALEKLALHLGVDTSRTIAIGDYNNDIGMFRAAGLGVAVANACQAAKDAADYITVSNEEHAIAQIISDIENGKIL
jgi:Cof subfamily protein (haloacid dehalogenase superfamily)